MSTERKRKKTATVKRGNLAQAMCRAGYQIALRKWPSALSLSQWGTVCLGLVVAGGRGLSESDDFVSLDITDVIWCTREKNRNRGRENLASSHVWPWKVRFVKGLLVECCVCVCLCLYVYVPLDVCVRASTCVCVPLNICTSACVCVHMCLLRSGKIFLLKWS